MSLSLELFGLSIVPCARVLETPSYAVYCYYLSLF